MKMRFMPNLPRAVLRNTAVACFALLLGNGATAGDYQNSPQVSSLISDMTRENGFAEEQLTAVFAVAERKQTILDAISRPAEKTKPWKDYRPIFLNNSRISKGASFWQQHAEALDRAEKEYGVPPQMFLSFIGEKTPNGGNTGG